MATTTAQMSVKSSASNVKGAKQTTNHKEVGGRFSTDSFKNQPAPRNPRGSNSSNRGA